MLRLVKGTEHGWPRAEDQVRMPPDEMPYRLRDDVPIPRLPPRGETKRARIVDDPLYNMMLYMKPGQSFVAPWSERPRIGSYIQCIRGRSGEMLFITRKIIRRYRGMEQFKIGVWRV